MSSILASGGRIWFSTPMRMSLLFLSANTALKPTSLRRLTNGASSCLFSLKYIVQILNKHLNSNNMHNKCKKRKETYTDYKKQKYFRLLLP